MSVRKRTWTDPSGAEKSAWVADYFDGQGKRRRKSFAKKKDAEKFLAGAKVEVGQGVHVVDSETVTIAEAGKLWLKSGDAAGLERTTLDQRRQHLDLHIQPFLGTTRLNKVTVPMVRGFQEDLREAGRSPAMISRVTVSLGGVFSDAQGRGLAVRNPVHDLPRSRGGEKAAQRRAKGRLTIGEDIPTRDEIKAFLSGLSGKWRPLLLTATFTGMRSSELRGLPWSAVNFDKRTIRVMQRADAYGVIGPPKSGAGHRTIPIPPVVVNTLREWKLACPKGKLGLVFPNGAGRVESHGNIVNRALMPAMVAAGVSLRSGRSDENGDPVMVAKYKGMHCLRHFFASWCINPVSEGGQGLQPKAVQEFMGHSSITMTLDVYGHLFPSDDDGKALEGAAASLLE